MIYGIGTDVCDIRRIRATLERKGERFAQKVLGPTEWWVYQYRKGKHAARGEAYLATRFSAKEAFSKAIGLGIHHPMTWRDCEILNQPSGQPFVRLHGELATWFAQRRLHAHMTVSDETEYVATFCVVERWPDGQPLPPEPVDRVALALARQAEAAAAALGSASGAGSGAADA